MIYYVFYKFFWEILIVGLSGLLQGQIWLASTIVLVALIVLTGIGLLLYYSTFMQKTIRSVRLFINNIAEIPKKIGLFFVNLHNQFREKFVLDILIGKNLISTKSKTFFWIIMFIQVVITIVFVLGAMILGIFNYATGVSSGAETMTYAMFVSFILFLFIGIFSTWFYHKILGTVTRPREDLDTKEKIPGRFEIKG